MSIESNPDNFRLVAGYRYTRPGEPGVFTYASTEPDRAVRNFLADKERGVVVSPLETYVPESAVAQAIANERKAIRRWLLQQAKQANRDAKAAVAVSYAWGKAEAFQEAADHLKPKKARKVTK